MDSREDSKTNESWEKRVPKLIRRDSMQQKPNMCLDAAGPEEFPSAESETVTEEGMYIDILMYIQVVLSSSALMQQSVTSQCVSICWTESCNARGRLSLECSF
ncbi:hypothetical protein R3I94_016697 [Phoxinus phoxinus]